MRALDAEGWVLAGGRSLRMGRDKAEVEIAGIPLLERMLRKLRTLGLRTRVAGRREALEGIAAEVESDLHPDCGPLSGIETALSRSEKPLVLVLGIDLPLIETDFLRWMLERARVTGAMAMIPRLLGEPQPLCAVYRRELLPHVTDALEASNYKVMAVVERAAERAADVFDVERVVAAGAWDSAFPVHWQSMNCNRPADVTTAAVLLAKAPML
jgi:molybdopterin-guanine dinucleotide biosynthesis protein A